MARRSWRDLRHAGDCVIVLIRRRPAAHNSAGHAIAIVPIEGRGCSTGCRREIAVGVVAVRRRGAAVEVRG